MGSNYYTVPILMTYAFHDNIVYGLIKKDNDENMTPYASARTGIIVNTQS